MNLPASFKYILFFVFTFAVCFSSAAQKRRIGDLFNVNKEQNEMLQGKRVILTNQEREWVEIHNGAIRLAPDPAFAPFEFFDEEGNYSGIGADYIALLQDKTGLEFSIVQYKDWNTIVEEAKKGNVDVFGVATPSVEREEYMLFTKPHLTMKAVIVTQSGVSGELTLDDLKGMNVCVVEGYVWQEMLENDYPDIHFDFVSNSVVGLRKVSLGVADAMVVSMSLASYYIDKEVYSNLWIAGEAEYYVEMAIAVRRDWPELLSILNKGLDAISRNEELAIKNKWLFHREVKLLESRQFWLLALYVTSGLLLIALTMWTFNRRLKRIVNEKTAALKKEKEQLRITNDKLLQAVEKASESDRLTKSFLANISHEIRTPMNSIMGFAQLIEIDQATEVERRHYANLMVKGGQQLLTILDNIIDLSKMDSGLTKAWVQKVNVGQLVKETCELMQPIAKKAGLDLHYSIYDSEGLERVKTDPILLQQVINNILTNAIKYTHEGEVSISAKLVGKKVRIEVADTGIGVPKEFNEGIFEPFQQVKHRSVIESGAGLGLAIAKRIMDVINGKIWVEENQPQGSVFIILFPVRLKK
ncbi:transporter substrate-binding domain-containing protein [Carboxylicivirga sp. A043]|uniref:ATP-binding protein n=1 Tax=Carboxylicivirga litoralis TaxID=2816963 RepID=UPI0021CB30A0|nr:transporter substrate-binding domain-containing protein [Carboxylicivirga sp. A043]MCU4155477.1 transporter substrate-binding domain-containing protein [Carboxylicivirga sp. A043]